MSYSPPKTTTATLAQTIFVAPTGSETGQGAESSVPVTMTRALEISDSAGHPMRLLLTQGVYQKPTPGPWVIPPQVSEILSFGFCPDLCRVDTVLRQDVPGDHTTLRGLHLLRNVEIYNQTAAQRFVFENCTLSAGAEAVLEDSEGVLQFHDTHAPSSAMVVRGTQPGTLQATGTRTEVGSVRIEATGALFDAHGPRSIGPITSTASGVKIQTLGTQVVSADPGVDAPQGELISTLTRFTTPTNEAGTVRVGSSTITLSTIDEPRSQLGTRTDPRASVSRILFSPDNTSWGGTPPQEVHEAVRRLALLVSAHHGPIPEAP